MDRPECDGQSPDTSKSTFRVWTATDFVTGRQVRERRRAGQLTAACRMCRRRKVKCVTSSLDQRPEMQQCQPCKNSSLDCKWDVVDGRRRKKSKRSCPNPNTPADGTGPIVDNPQQLSDINDALQQQNNWQPSTNEKEMVSIDHVRPSATRTAPSAGGELAISTEADVMPAIQVNLDSYQEPQQPFEALFTEPGMDMTQDWADLPDFIFGVDVLDHYENAGQEYFLPGRAKSQTPAAVFSRPRLVKLRYYRRLGPTAVVPGFRRLTVTVNPDSDETYDVDPSNSAAELLTLSPLTAASDQSRLFDKSNRQPHADIMPVIIDVFFQHFHGHFPFLHPEILNGHVQTGEASSFLLNSIAAITVRFCSAEGPLAYLQERYTTNWARGAPFLKKAKEQLMSLLSLPEPEVLSGLIILSWAEFGDNSETGLWMLTGMAIRMAQDLGYHQTPETNANPHFSFHDNARPSSNGKYTMTNEESAMHQKMARHVLFWSVFILDVCVSLVTGRPPTIRQSEIETSLPTAHDMKLVQLDIDEEISMKNIIFPATVTLMLHFSEALCLLNRPAIDRSSDSRSSRTACDLDDARLSHLRQKLLQSYNSLPMELAFTIPNYKLSMSNNQSGSFLLLHLFFYTFMALLSNSYPRNARQGLQLVCSGRSLYSPIANEDRAAEDVADGDGENRCEIARIACQKMAQMLTISDLVDPKGYLTSPFTSHCCFIAASTMLRDTDFGRKEHRLPQDTFLGTVADVDYEFFHLKLQQQSKYFGAISAVTAVLDRRREAFASNGGSKASGGSDDEDDDEDGIGRVVALGDPGIVNRYTIR